MATDPLFEIDHPTEHPECVHVGIPSIKANVSITVTHEGVIVDVVSMDTCDVVATCAAEIGDLSID